MPTRNKLRVTSINYHCHRIHHRHHTIASSRSRMKDSGNHCGLNKPRPSPRNAVATPVRQCTSPKERVPKTSSPKTCRATWKASSKQTQVFCNRCMQVLATGYCIGATWECNVQSHLARANQWGPGHGTWMSSMQTNTDSRPADFTEQHQ